MIGKVMDNKNKKNPLERMGAKPNPTFFQKANILFKAINRKNISCKRYSLYCSELCQTYRCKQNAVFQSSCRVFHDVSSRTVVFSVYRLVLDAKPDRVML